MQFFNNCRYVLVFLIVFVLGNNIHAQNIKIELGQDEVALNQGFTITIVVSNEGLRSYDNFPDFEGFTKRGTSSSRKTNIINGQISSTRSIIMTYAPTAQGLFTLPPFEMEVNGKKIKSPGKKVKVGPAVQRKQNNKDPLHWDPFEDFFGRKRDTPQEFVDIEDDAFLSLSTNKNEVYIGEGFTTTLAFYVPDDNRAPLQFYDLSRQVSEILKQVRPSNCWEENFNIENINGEPVTVNNKGYTKFKIYQATFYPLNSEDIKFPSVELEMIKYKVARNPSFFGQNRKEDYKSFHSRPKTISVKNLPEHPLKNKVAVGNYRLNEVLNETKLNTGESFSYEFNVYGIGNISSIEKPEIKEGSDFDFYPPNIYQNVNRRNDKVTGSKSFSYYGIPNEPGVYNLGDYFEWIFFNPEKHKYDTLKSEKIVTVVGESKKNEHIRANDLGPFYDRIELEDNTLVDVNRFEWVKIFVNIFILIMLAVSAFIFFKRT